ncbi:hypothetical protein C3489_36840 [Streptomyces sp. Ru71]|nr:hypothetical protein C3489_36840 [Streptomyces sp. Ru71]
MFYEDLTEYDYLPEDSFTDRESGFYALRYRPAYSRLNVGWLEAGRPYRRGPVPPEFVENCSALAPCSFPLDPAWGATPVGVAAPS